MACPCCQTDVPNCGCVGVFFGTPTCTVNVTYNGLLYSQSMGANNFPLFYAPSEGQQGFATPESSEPGVIFAVLAGTLPSGGASEEGGVTGRQFRLFNIRTCPSENDIDVINAQKCPNEQGIEKVNTPEGAIFRFGRYAGRPINLIIYYGEHLGIYEADLYSVVIDDGTPCPLPAGQPTTKYVLENIGTIRLGGNAMFDPFETLPAAVKSAKCSAGCDGQVDALRDSLATISVCRLDGPQVKAVRRGFRNPPERGGGFSPIFSGFGPPFICFDEIGCTEGITIGTVGPFNPHPGNFLTKIGAGPEGQTFNIPANGYAPIFTQPPPGGCVWTYSSSASTAEYSFGEWEYACQFWGDHPTPSVSLVCAP